MKATLPVVPMLLALMSCSNANVAELTQRDTDVLRAVLAWRCDRIDGGYVVVSTKPAPMDARAVKYDKEHAAHLRAEIARRSEVPVSWPLLDICPAVVMVEEKSIEATFEKDERIPRGWETFQSTYAGALGVLKVSLPVFAPDGNYAVVVTDYNCDATCGHGSYFELRKEGDAWKVTLQRVTWIS